MRKIAILGILTLCVSPAFGHGLSTQANQTLAKMFTQAGQFGPPPYASDPFTCDATTIRSTYYNTTANTIKYCSGSSWTSLATGAGGITIGTTTVTGGATTQVLFNLAGVVSSDADFVFATDTVTFTKGIGSTSVCGAAALGAANSVCLGSNALTSEGSSADANKLTLAFGNHTAPQTLTLTSAADGVGLTGAVLGFGGPAVAATPVAIYPTAGATLISFYNAVPTLKALFGEVNTAEQLVVGSVAGDFVLRTQGGNILFSTDSGSTAAIRINTAGHIASLPLALTASTMTPGVVAQMRGVVNSYTWSNAQVAALAGTAGDIPAVTLPAKTRLTNAYVVITGAAVGPTTVTVSCGDANDGTPFIGYVVPSDAKAAPGTVYGDVIGERGASIDTEFYYLPSYTATKLVTCHFISTGADLSTVTGSTGMLVLTTELLP